MKKKFAFLLAGAMLMTAALAGCGGDAGNTQTDDPAAGNSSSAVEAIKAKGEIVMLTNAQFPPFEYMDASGEIKGVDVDIANEIASDLGVKLTIVDMDFDAIPEAVQTGKGDFAAAGMTIRPDRQKVVDFSDEYVKSAQYVVVPIDSTLTADDAALSGKTISVQEGTTGDFYASGDEEIGSEIVDANVLKFKSGLEAGMAVVTGKADALIIDEMPAKKIVENNADTLKLLDTPLTEEEYALAIAKGSDLTAAVNQTLQRLADEGKIESFINTHMGVE